MDDIQEVCKTCGNCCKNTVPLASEKDIRRWKRENRKDILENLESHYLWFRMKKLNGACVFYDGEMCTIHDTKPESCKSFPHSEDDDDEETQTYY
jgi:Fe-S-cluster containining protein